MPRDNENRAMNATEIVADVFADVSADIVADFAANYRNFSNVRDKPKSDI